MTKLCPQATDFCKYPDHIVRTSKRYTENAYSCSNMSLNPYSNTFYTGNTAGSSYPNPTQNVVSAPSGSAVYDPTVTGTQSSATCPTATHWLGTPSNDPELPALLVRYQGASIPEQGTPIQTSSARYWIWLIGTVGVGSVWLVSAYSVISEATGYTLTGLATYLRSYYPVKDLQNTLLTAHGDACEDAGKYQPLEQYIDDYLTRCRYSFNKRSGPSTEQPAHYILDYTAWHYTDPQATQALNFTLRSSELGQQGLTRAQALPQY